MATGAHEASTASQWKFLDALDRAWRTFYTLVGVDMLLALGNGLTQVLQEKDPMTGAFWQFVLLLLIKTVIAAVASFLLRYAKQPKVATVAELKN